MNDLALIDSARRALAQAKSIGDLTELRDQAAALDHYMRRKAGAEEAARHALDIRLRAERRIGELLAEAVESHRPAEVSLGSTVLPTGVSRDQSSKYQRIAELPEAVFERVLASTDPSTSALVKAWKKTQVSSVFENPGACTVGDLEELIAAGVRFGTIYVDPPWPYENQGTRAATSNHYPSMTIDEIALLPVEALAANSAHLHLWTTNSFLPDALALISKWGFEYRGLLVWAKPQLGTGNYWRVCNEILLLGVRGAAPFREHSHRSWLEVDRGRHSKKPAEFRQLIERVSPGPRLELFSRECAEGWTCWGIEITRRDFSPNGARREPPEDRQGDPIVGPAGANTFNGGSP